MNRVFFFSCAREKKKFGFESSHRSLGGKKLLALSAPIIEFQRSVYASPLLIKLSAARDSDQSFRGVVREIGLRGVGGGRDGLINFSGRCTEVFTNFFFPSFFSTAGLKVVELLTNWGSASSGIHIFSARVLFFS